MNFDEDTRMTGTGPDEDNVGLETPVGDSVGHSHMYLGQQSSVSVAIEDHGYSNALFHNSSFPFMPDTEESGSDSEESDSDPMEGVEYTDTGCIPMEGVEYTDTGCIPMEGVEYTGDSAADETFYYLLAMPLPAEGISLDTCVARLVEGMRRLRLN
ncbi:hypothetical protein NQ176_g10394 [Zarea fungicola]|uniref:Uncharacterized protein n=1 Tax=Zarea fungicola TaxID=93591 RepID=A0ACC1MGE2_9HYPO|nr:hypothetical protein NQ176_g10394 [Lecanicillium fungicola]